jgi:hypothetical protein
MKKGIKIFVNHLICPFGSIGRQMALGMVDLQSVIITLPLTPSHQGRGKFMKPLLPGGEGKGNKQINKSRVHTHFVHLYYSKRINYLYMFKQCVIDFKIPLTPPFFKGGNPLFPSLV